MYKLKIFDIPFNFGDMLSTYILDYFKITYTLVTDMKNANLFTVGSIARLAPKGSTIVGSGIIRKKETLQPNCRWLAVRGPITRDKVLECGYSCPKVYGDPALFLPRLVQQEKTKHKIALIPHYCEYQSVLRRYGDHYKVINVVNKNPLIVAKEISSCEKTISSSLHGIIASHAYGIPSSRFVNKKLHGDGVKFEDYFASIGSKCVISTIENPTFMEPKFIDLDPLENAFRSIGD